MSYDTIKGSIPINNKSIIESAKEHRNPIIKFLVNLFNLIFKKTLDKTIDELTNRSQEKEEEICNVALDLLKNLPNSYENLNVEKTLHTNIKQNYQIRLEGSKLILYKGNISKINKKEFIPYKNGEKILSLDKNNYHKFMNRLNEIYKTEKYKSLIKNKTEKLENLTFSGKQLLTNLREIATNFSFNHQEFNNYFVNLKEQEKNKIHKDYLIIHLIEKINNHELGPEEYNEIILFFLKNNPDLQNKLTEIWLDNKKIMFDIHDSIAQKKGPGSLILRSLIDLYAMMEMIKQEYYLENNNNSKSKQIQNSAILQQSNLILLYSEEIENFKANCLKIKEDILIDKLKIEKNIIFINSKLNVIIKIEPHKNKSLFNNKLSHIKVESEKIELIYKKNDLIEKLKQYNKQLKQVESLLNPVL